MSLFFRLLCLMLALGLLAPSGASAAERWAAPSIVRGSPTCLASDPCALAEALDGAKDGDEVVLVPGDYPVDRELNVRERVTLRGQSGLSRPVLVGADKPAVVTLKPEGRLRHVEIRAGKDALHMQGGRAEDVVLSSAKGDGAKIDGSPAEIVLRDAVVRTDATDREATAVRVHTSGVARGVTFINVTAMAPKATGIRCEASSGSVTLVNTLVRGAVRDVDVSKDAQCSATYSNFRSNASPNLAKGTGNQESEPVFVDRDGGDYRPAAGSPTVDAGTLDPLLGATDAAGCPRVLGAAPDIGAYEWTNAPCAVTSPDEPDPATEAPRPATEPPPPVAPAPDTSAELPEGVPAPVQGATIVVSPESGKVLVRRPGTKRFRALAAGARLPVGSELDTRAGRLRLVTAVTGGLQDGTFWGGRFIVGQSREGSGMTSLTPRGGSFRGCRNTSAKRRLATASAKKAPVRRLWARDHDGRF